MLNFERWSSYTDGLTSPQNYVDWTWRYIISAALQRRVWLPPKSNPCFANMYSILVGKRGVGKGLCISVAKDFLTHWRLEDSIKLARPNINGEDKVIAESTIETDLKVAKDNEMQATNKQNSFSEPLLIPVAPDAITYESFVETIAESYRRVNYVGFDEKLQKPKLNIYGHSSICLCLPELASLLRKRTEDTVNFMLGLYDCPEDYTYKTKTQGCDRVKRGCLNMLAGTTPEFMQQILNEKLIDQGYGSRTFFIYGHKDRKIAFWLPDITQEQLQHKKELLDHILKLTPLYGEVKLDNDTKSFLESWWQSYYGKWQNKSPKLEGYYARKKVHVMKVAMAEHFGESLEMYIPKEIYQKAIDILEQEEKNMHLALTMESSNPLSRVANFMLELLNVNGPMNFVDIMVATYHMADRKQITEALDFLKDANQIKDEFVMNKDTDQQVIHYRIK